jgi:hypothetical protein
MTNIEILTGLLSMKCSGFSGTIMLHIDSQEDFEALSVLDPRMMLKTEMTSDGSFYDVVAIQVPGGLEVYLFSPHRKTRVVMQKPAPIEVEDRTGEPTRFSFIEVD